MPNKWITLTEKQPVLGVNHELLERQKISP